MTEGMQQMARMAAREAVNETFVALGLDIKDPISVQGQFAFLRNCYYSARHIRNVAIGAVASAAVTGIGYAIWTAVKAGSAVAGVK